MLVVLSMAPNIGKIHALIHRLELLVDHVYVSSGGQSSTSKSTDYLPLEWACNPLPILEMLKNASHAVYIVHFSNTLAPSDTP
jgi:hypothetical protein